MNTNQRIAALLERARRDNDAELIELLSSQELPERLRLPTERELALRDRAEMHIDPLSGYYIHPDDMLDIHGRPWSQSNLLRFVFTNGQNKIPVWPDTGTPMSADDLTRIGVSTNSTGQVVMTGLRPGVGFGLGAAGLIGGLALGSALASRPYYYYGYPYGPYGGGYAPYGGYGGGYRYGYDPFDFDDDDDRRRRGHRRSSSEERGRNRRIGDRDYRGRARSTSGRNKLNHGEDRGERNETRNSPPDKQTRSGRRNKLNHGEDRGERNETRNSPPDSTRRRTGNRNYASDRSREEIGPVFDTYLDDFDERLYSAGHASTRRSTKNDPLV